MEIQLNSCLTAYENVKKGETFILYGAVYIKICHKDHCFRAKLGQIMSSVRLSDGEIIHPPTCALVKVIQGKFTKNA